MSTAKINTIQLGQSGTATQNFVLTTGTDGTMKLARGNAGATTQDVLTVGADGKVNLLNNPTCSVIVRRTSSFVTTASTSTVVPFNTVDNDPKGLYSTSTGRFQPNVSGLYSCSWSAVVGPGGATPARMFLSLFKNGVEAARSSDITGSSIGGVSGATLISMNGTTDYLDVRVYTDVANVQLYTAAIPDLTRFTAHLVSAI